MQRQLLVVDDDPSTREAIDSALKKEYTVFLAADEEEALHILDRHPIDLLILDVHLQDRDGLGLLEEIRRRCPLPCLIITGYSTEALAIRSIWSQVQGYLKKPFGVAELKEAVARLLGRPQRATDAALAFMREHCQQRLRAVEIAAAVKVGERTLRNRFKAETGRTHLQYLQEIRLQEARRLLQESDLSVREVSLRVGFADPTHFARRFKQTYGLSPATFRRQGWASG